LIAACSVRSRSLLSVGASALTLPDRVSVSIPDVDRPDHEQAPGAVEEPARAGDARGLPFDAISSGPMNSSYMRIASAPYSLPMSSG